MKVFVSGLAGQETTLAVRGFPVTYYPVDYPFFGIKAEVSGSGYNIACGLRALGDDVSFLTLIGNDVIGRRVEAEFDKAGLSREHLYKTLTATLEAVVLQETPFGRRQVYCDLKDVQDKTVDVSLVRDSIASADVCVMMNTNFNRALLAEAKAQGKTLVTDVQNLSDVNDPFNSDFIENADILFLSAEGAPTAPREFMAALSAVSSARLIIMGLAAEGALLYDRASGQIHALKAVDVGRVITSGAGAALLSGFVHYYGAFTAIEALKRAEVFAALKLAANSSGGGFPSERDVEAKLAAVTF